MPVRSDISLVPCKTPKTKFGEESSSEGDILPAVDEYVDTGVEHQQQGGDDGHHITPLD